MISMADVILVTMRPICIPFGSIGDSVETVVVDIVVVGGAVGAVEVVVFAFVVVVVVNIG